MIYPFVSPLFGGLFFACLWGGSHAVQQHRLYCHGVSDMVIPFAGYKQSGWGRENAYEALLQYTELKSVVAKL